MRDWGNMQLTGRSIIGYTRGAGGGATLRAVGRDSGEAMGPDYGSASDEEVDKAAQLAAAAFLEYGRMPGQRRAVFLRLVAEKIEAIGEPLVARATAETALPAARIQAETGRTSNQLRMFADLIEEGSWVDARLDRAAPARQPAPKPDVRSLLRPLGPVVVFGASNFPLAFSTAGGDTASALAAGCPVIVKAHPAHPGTAELVGLAVQQAAQECGLPEGVFSLLYGVGNDLGVRLVRHPLVKAVGFTGSRQGGLALMRQAQAREVPIPFYAEMSSVNPVFILPGALQVRGEQIAAGLQASVTLGAGQFCTNPGLVFIEEGPGETAFVDKLSATFGAAPEFTMLTDGIGEAYQAAVSRRAGCAEALVHQNAAAAGERTRASLFRTDVGTFLATRDLGEEIFGPTTLIVTHANREELLRAAAAIEGQLTATIHGTEEDLHEYGDLVALLETRAGRLLFNGFPTGVEVGHAMVHGGPFPATSDGRSTSVGSRAIFRFARPVCYQDFPDSALPEELKNANPLGLQRLLDGVPSREPVS